MSLNPVQSALRRPYTVTVAVLVLVLAGSLALWRMRVDIFPSLNLPVIYVCQPYGGMDPAQMEGLLANYYEYHFLYISGIHHVESKNVQGVSLMKLVFHPGTDMAQAMAETIAYVNRSRAFMPPGTVPPFVMRFDTGSVPVGYLVMSSETKSINEIQDQALFKVRPKFASVEGVSAPPPFGGNARTVVVHVKAEALRALGVSPDEIVHALALGNTVSPSGTARIGDKAMFVPVNSMVTLPQELGSIPIKPRGSIYLRDVATIEDGADIPTGYALVNGRRAVYITVTKRANASTLSVINAVKANLPKWQEELPKDIKVTLELDQSPVVTGALWGVGIEALLGAGLTGLMVLLFLRDWRSVIVVVLTIPLALLGAVIGLWLTGNTLNLMTLGGLALAVGILIDEATVAVENIHSQLRSSRSVARAVRNGIVETAVPRLLALFCILAVFVPAAFMEGAAQALFVPLALAVMFAMTTSYLLSSTFVPVLSIWLLRHVGAHRASKPPLLQRLYGYTLKPLLVLRWPLTIGYVIAAGGVVWWFGSHLGRDLFPKTDQGLFQIRLRAQEGTRIEKTEEIAKATIARIAREVGTDNLAVSLGYVGIVPPAFPVNSVYLWMRGPEEAVLRVAIKRDTGIRVETLMEKLREGLAPELAQQFGPVNLSFEPADIINEVMSFGSPTPVEIVISGAKLADSQAYAEKLLAELKKEPHLRDVQITQSLNYPAVQVTIDRERAGQSGVSATDVSRSLVVASSSSRFVTPVYWATPDTGIAYQVQVEIPPFQMNSPDEIGLVPVKGQVLLRDVADVHLRQMPGEFDRYNMKRVITITANLTGTDLGTVARNIAAARERVGAMPMGMTVDVRGQVTPLHEVLSGLSYGLIVAVIAIFLLLTSYFQSMRLAIVALATAPAALAGIVLMLTFTGMTLNIQSFLGSIMALGVAVANAILLVSFAERERLAGSTARDAVCSAAAARVRPILMTSFAMIAGMLPLALGHGSSGDQMAPLGRAVIGGLAVATATTLFLLPGLYSIVLARAARQSASLDPDDPASQYHDAFPSPTHA